MISRRLLRVKALQILYAFFNSDKDAYTRYNRELDFSINKFYDMYYYLMLLLLDIAKHSEDKIEQAKQRRMASAEDISPNTRFVDNRILAQLKDNPKFNSYLRLKKMSWINHPELIKNLYTEIINSDDFHNYMNSEENNYKADKEIVLNVVEKIFPHNEFLAQVLEEQSIFWNDDLEFALSMILKTISKAKKDTGINILDLYKSDEDEEFVKNLFKKTINNYNDNLALIKKFSKNWEIERIALIDIVIMQMAVTELTEFSSIPSKVSLNEYIDLAKFYSTPKSGVFINGILDKILIHLKKENKLEKRGRGLIGEV